ncbi:methylmalonyl Co-A mutase-associated GTPase MeaB [Priestia megaterium]|nr:methylmalonyl Co-A mutase-associated GTPase MeaB [Priestia megaterium]
MAKIKDVAGYKEGLLKHDRVVLAQAITLIESQALKHRKVAQELIKEIYPYTGESIRIGFTGVPGAGKSTLIDRFGTYLCNEGHRVAVLAIDPSSTVSGGSILGDKTRMENLSRNPKAFVRPSPSQGTLGGVHRKTREAILLCEAAGYDVIFVETMGVGQGETIVKQMVDVFVLLVLTGAGDELQGIKKGILELADLICVNKADGDNQQKAYATKKEYESVIAFLHGHSAFWVPRVMTTSVYYEKDIMQLWKQVNEFKEWMNMKKLFQQKRNQQLTSWLQAGIHEYLYESFYENDIVKNKLKVITEEMNQGTVTMGEALELVISTHQKAISNETLKG